MNHSPALARSWPGLLCVLMTSIAAAAPAGGVRIPAWAHTPLYRSRADSAAARDADTRRDTRRPVAAFDMDVLPVTNAEFLEFVRSDPQWRRSNVQRLLADAAYLRHWASDLELGPDAPPRAPVVNVSWFAARAFLRARGKALPSIDQWEYAAAAEDASNRSRPGTARDARLREWYSRPTPRRLPPVGAGAPNRFGVADLDGLVWEWTEDFNSLFVSGESRGEGARDRERFCGGSAMDATDFAAYPAFMRYALRGSLEADYCLANLGFRGVSKRETRP